MKLASIGAILPLFLAGCASTTSVLPPAAEGAVTALAKGENRPSAFDTRESSPAANALGSIDTVARVVPVQCESGKPFIPLAHEQRFKIGVQVARPNVVGIAMISRWQ